MGKSKSTKYVSFSDIESLQSILKNIVPNKGSLETGIEADLGSSASTTFDEEALSALKVSTSQVCSLCSVQFGNLSEQRQHFKLDWHRYNIRRKLQSKSIVNEDEFNQIADKLNQKFSSSSSQPGTDDWDVMSLSGSETDSENEETSNIEEKDDVGNAHPNFFFQNDQNQILSVFKAAFVDSSSKNSINESELLSKISRLSERNFSYKWCFLMLGGGHFAGAIFQNSSPIVHKTFHCYTVRAKQGGSQSSADNKSGTNHPKSAGASLRRYNQIALMNHVRSILNDWKSHINECDIVFYRAVSGNRSVLFGDGYFDKKDPRFRTIPFPTRRATFGEVKRVHEILSCVRIHAESENEQSESKRSPKKKFNIRRSKSRESPKRTLPKVVQDLADSQSLEWNPNLENIPSSLQEFESSVSSFRKNKKKIKHKSLNFDVENSIEQIHTPPTENELFTELKNELVTACKCGDVQLLKRCLEDLSSDDLATLEFGNEKLSPLHIATMNGRKNLIPILLAHGADPSRRDKKKQVPYFMCPDKETRNAYRRYQAEHPDQYDYKAAQIPIERLLTAEEENAQQLKKLEKKKAQRAVKKEKEKLAKAEEEIIRKEEEEKRRFLNLSDREKRALAAEKRILETSGSISSAQRCFSCGLDITGKVPFSYMDFRFCTTTCLRKHKQK